MSEGPRITLDRVPAIEAWCRKLWPALDPATCDLVGSARRRRPDVGDIEFTAPMPPIFEMDAADLIDDEDDDLDDSGIFGSPEAAAVRRCDPLFEQLLATCRVDGVAETDKRPARAVKGLKAGFRYCQLMLRCASGGEIPVEFWRYSPPDGLGRTNRGWITLMRTGPQDFGTWLLEKWKREMKLYKRPGSKDGWLMDPMGVKVSVPTEEALFTKLQMKPVAPEDRDAFLEQVIRGRNGWVSPAERTKR